MGMVAHHALALLLACLAVNKDIYYFYGTYFFGVSELSSLPLVFLDLFKMFPDVKKRYPVSNELIRPFFLYLLSRVADVLLALRQLPLLVCLFTALSFR